MAAQKALFHDPPVMKALRLLQKYPGPAAYLAVALLIFLPLFGHLDEPPIQMWDELRNAQNALEMSRTGKLIVTTFQYVPETWNTKPPMMIWILALSQRILGYNELAIRLPSAIAAALTCFLLLRLSKRRAGHWLPGIIAVLILITTGGYVMIHGTRTGDFDTLLTLFTTSAVCCFTHFVEEEKPHWLWLSFLSVIAAVLTKGIAGLFIAPALLVYVLIRRKGGLLFKTPSLYVCIALFIMIIGGYYWLREGQQPGYLQAVWENELGGRYNVAAETHQGDGWFYYDRLRNESFGYWHLLILPALFAAPFARDPRIRHASIMCLLAALSVLVIVSMAATKLFWYMMPALPFLAMLCALVVYQAIVLLREWRAPLHIWSVNFLPALLVVFMGFPAYRAIIDSTINGNYPKLEAGAHDTGVYLKEVVAGNRTLGGNILCGDAYALFWYTEVLRLKGADIREAGRETLQAGMDVVVWEDGVKNYIRKHYATSVRESFRNTVVFHIEGPAPDALASPAPQP